METKHKVYLIGGTSHTGKSTIARALSSQLCWDYQSTDTLARHVAYPWNEKSKQVKRFVAFHYESLTPEELVADIERHAKRNVWPLASELINTHSTQEFQNCLVLEGATLLPDQVAQLDYDNLACIWLTSSDKFLEQRIHAASEYKFKGREEKLLIDTFIERACIFNQRIEEKRVAYGLPGIEVEAYPELKSLKNAVLQKLAKQSQSSKAEFFFS